MALNFTKDSKYSAYKGHIELHFTNNVECSENDVVLLIGPNGIGKSTLAKMMTNFIDYKPIGDSIKFPSNILFHPQELIFLPGNVSEDYNVFLNDSTFKYEKNIKGMGDFLLNLFEEHKNKSVNDLSGGEKQLILILRTLLAYKKFYHTNSIQGIVFDEPSKQLSNNNFKLLKEQFLNKFTKVKFPLFFITHEFNLVHAIFQIFLKAEKSISFFEIKEKENSNKIKEVSYIGKFSKDNIEENWETIAKNDYIQAFFEHREHACFLQNNGSNEDLGKVVISYPFHSGLYKVIAKKNNIETEYLSLKPKNSKTDLKKNEIILQFSNI